jgi:hypothetical protein
MGGVAALVFGQIVAGAGLTLSFGQPVDDGLTAQQEGLRVTATNAAFSAIAWGTAVLSAISAVIAWLTLEHKDKAAAK